MNINRVYLCDICLKTYEYSYWDNNGNLRHVAECSHVKNTIVYNGECNGEYIDLFSKEKYKHVNKYDSRVGELFISGKMLPLNKVIITYEDKKVDNLPKRKVLKIGKLVLDKMNDMEKEMNNQNTNE